MSEESRETRAFGSDGGPRRLAPGQVLSRRYRLDGELGRGGMGVVYRATDLQLRREVAVKALPAAVSSPEARERLLREARAAAALNHPHIVSVHDVGDDRGLPFFVMELVRGPTLCEERLSDPEGIVALACQVCEALAHAHSHGLVHRDVKPGNLLLAGGRDAMNVKLADLGLAMPADGSRITQEGAIVGTVAYMAPEQALGKPVDGRADLYALGVVLYELTTGRLPFGGDHALGIISQHVNAPVVPPRSLRPDLPPALEAVILRLLAKEPERRFATADETGKALRRSLDPPDAAAAEPVAAIALLDALSRGRLVGRVEELGETRELWRRARDGRGHCLLLSGEPGAGKTRLARELMLQAALDGASLLTGACYEYEAATPYLPFAEAFRRWARAQKDDVVLRKTLGEGASLLARLAPEIETRLGRFPRQSPLPPHEERLLFLDAVVLAFRGLAESRGLLFYVDDLQWADSGTLWLFSHLLRALREERVLLVASHREVELDRAHPLAKALVDWNRERLTTRIVIGRFGPRETAAQLAALLGQDVSAEFAGAVHKETEGNPFFVEEVLKALIEQGSVRREEGRWRCSELRDLHIPQSVKATIGHRLDGVSVECNDVLRWAAVLGTTFHFPELLAVAGDCGEDSLLDALDQAVAAQLIIAGRDDSFAFTHDKVREVLYEELNPVRRRRLHKRTADALERHRSRAVVAVETLAHHFMKGGDHEKGLVYAKEAGAEAERLLAYDEAIAAYGRALECAESLGLVGERAFLEEVIGDACISGGNMIQALEHFERALALATDPAARARLRCQAANSLVVLGEPRGLEYAREALTILDPATHPVETARALAIQARFHHLAGRHWLAIELLERAEGLISSSGTAANVTLAAPMLSTAYLYLAGAYQHLGRFDDADQWARRALEFGTEHEIPWTQAFAYEYLGEGACFTGEWKVGLAHAEREREITARIRSRERRAWTYFIKVLCFWGLGEYERAEAEAREGIELAETIGERRLASLLSGNLAVTLAELGRRDEALRLGLETVKEADALGLLYTKTEARRCMARVRFLRGELDETAAACQQVLDLTERLESRISRLWAGPLHVAALFGLGRRSEARARLDAYSALVGEVQSPYYRSEVTRLEALLAGS